MNNPKALITGASSGIGEAFAYRFASRSHDLILTGRRIEKLQEIRCTCMRLAKIDVEIIVAEFSSQSQVDRIKERIQKTGIDVLINNAGYGTTRSFAEDTIESQIAMLDVHVGAMLKLTHAALPAMLEKRNGIIINVSSLAAVLPIPSVELYCGTKAFIKSFSESLAMGVRQSGIRVQALCPGFTYTDFHRKMGIPDTGRKNSIFVRWMHAGYVVEQSLKALDKGVIICIPGFWNKFTAFFFNALPRPLSYAIMNSRLVANKRVDASIQ